MGSEKSGRGNDDGQPPKPEFSLTARARATILLAGILLPVVCFAEAFREIPNVASRWQAGWTVKASLFFDGPVSRPFYPFLAYSILAVLTFVIHPAAAARSWIARFGIHTGVILALQYVGFLGIESKGWVALLPFIFLVLYALDDRFPRLRVGLIGLVILTAGFIQYVAFRFAVAVEWRDIGFPQWSIFLMIYLLALSPFWALFTYGWLSFRLFRAGGSADLASTHSWTGAFVWLGCYGLAWVESVRRMSEAYAALPTTPPECYVTTAAARGHRRVVGSASVPLAGGGSFHANEQLRRFKLAELVLLAALPGGHRSIRRVYDRIGRQAAGWIRSPIAADFAYLALKPLEWGVWFVLRAALPGADHFAERIYRKSGKGSCIGLTTRTAFIGKSRDPEVPPTSFGQSAGSA